MEQRPDSTVHISFPVAQFHTVEAPTISLLQYHLKFQHCYT